MVTCGSSMNLGYGVRESSTARPFPKILTVPKLRHPFELSFACGVKRTTYQQSLNDSSL